jgi:hypothetical protein
MRRNLRYETSVLHKSKIVIFLSALLFVTGCSKSAGNAISSVVLLPFLGAAFAYDEIFSEEESATVYCKREDGTIFYYSVFKSCLKDSYTEITKDEYFLIKKNNEHSKSNKESHESDKTRFRDSEKIIEDKIRKINEMEENGLITSEEASVKRSILIEKYIDH